MSDFSIRLARPGDAEHFPAIERAAGTLFQTVEGLSGVAGMDPISEGRHRALIRKGHCLVAAKGETLVGFLCAEPQGRELAIREISVHPDHGRQGIGSVLLRACGIDAANSGFRAITLTTFADVPWNAPFYAHHGFETVQDLAAHPRLKAEIEEEAQHGLPPERRIAMIRFLD